MPRTLSRDTSSTLWNRLGRCSNVWEYVEQLHILLPTYPIYEGCNRFYQPLDLHFFSYPYTLGAKPNSSLCIDNLSVGEPPISNIAAKWTVAIVMPLLPNSSLYVKTKQAQAGHDHLLTFLQVILGNHLPTKPALHHDLHIHTNPGCPSPRGPSCWTTHHHHPAFRHHHWDHTSSTCPCAASGLPNPLGNVECSGFTAHVKTQPNWVATNKLFESSNQQWE